jgi:hypothetical protein
VGNHREVPGKDLDCCRSHALGELTLGVRRDRFVVGRDRSDDSLVFGHATLGTPVDPTKLSRDYMLPALEAAGITKPFRPWHDLRHTALTHEAAAGNPHAYVQAKAGHSQHDHRPLHPRSAGALSRSGREGRGTHVRRGQVAKPVANAESSAIQNEKKPRIAGLFQ